MKKKVKENKTITKILRLSPNEWNQISAKMSELGGITFSEFAIKSMLSRKLIKTPVTKELVLELSRQGNNLNQLVHKLNKGESFDRVALTIVSQSLEALNSIYELLNNKQNTEDDS